MQSWARSVKKAKAASAQLAYAASDTKQKALMAAADAVWAQRAKIISANQKDMAYGRDKGLTDAMMDRLMLDEPRIQGITDSLHAVCSAG